MEPEKIKKIISLLRRKYGSPSTALEYRTPFQLLVSTILSAQCTDKRVNKVTSILFKKYKTPEDFVKIKLERLEKLIYSTGFYKNKSKNIKESSRLIINNFNGKIPDNMEQLLTLKGVSRKTANCVLNHAFNKSEGIVVDTHVIRLTNRIGLTKESNPVKIEKDLMRTIKKKDWIIISSLLIKHGRSICKARKPACPDCTIKNLCKYEFKTVNI